MQQVTARLPDDLIERIDQRAASVGLSRNAWLVKALTWAVEQPIRTQTVKERT
jgi:predicted transcriptional regulator